MSVMKLKYLFFFLFLNFFCLINVFASELININSADLEGLDSLPGIGATKAQAIIDYRDNNGFFNTLEELMSVPGIGESTFNALKDLITIESIIEDNMETEDGEDLENNLSTNSTEVVSQENPVLGDLVINEFVSDPSDDGVEWVEMYNNTNNRVNLTGWFLEEGSGAKTFLDGFVEAKSYYVQESPKGNLNNSGDVVILKYGEILIDKVVYGNWEDGGAPVANDPFSVARLVDGYNTFDNKADFRLTSHLSKGLLNVIVEPKAENEEVGVSSGSYDYDYGDSIIISEIMPNPEGLDNDGEFVELYNKGNSSINLFGWVLKDESGLTFEFKEKIFLERNEYLALFRSETDISLNNASESISLYKPLESIPSYKVSYESAEEGYSYSFDLQGKKYVWSEVATPNGSNDIKIPNRPPLVDFSFPEVINVGVPIIFDSSDTMDEDGDQLFFSWSFGDGVKLELESPQHTFLKPGEHTVVLNVDDGEIIVEKETLINVLGEIELNKDELVVVTNIASGTKIEISEFLPNPKGTDNEGEFVEIYNPNDFEVNLVNWQIDDDEGGSKSFEFGSDLWLGAKDFYTLTRKESGLALNNNHDAIRVLNPQGNIVDEVRYEKSFEDQSYSRIGDDQWVWTANITPEEENVVTVLSSPVSTTVVKKVVNQSFLKNKAELKDVNNYGVGDGVVVRGVVAVLPGVLSSQYFYIISEDAGLQVYSNKKDFPELEIGDYIEVEGELSQVNNENRLKTKTAENMVFIEHRGIFDSEKINNDEVVEGYLGRLVEVGGEIVEKKGSSLYLDDGFAEIEVYLKKMTNIKASSFDQGDQLYVTGIVSKNKDGVFILPRFIDDIVNIKESGDYGEGQVLGDFTENETWSLEERNGNNKVYLYLIIILSGVIVFLSFKRVKKQSS